MSTLIPTISPELPITYYPAVKREFGHVVPLLGWDPERLWLASEEAIRTRYQEARVIDPSDEGRGRHPTIYTLHLDRLNLHFTVESQAVVIRGYSWDFEVESLDESERGHVYHDVSWHQF